MRELKRACPICSWKGAQFNTMGHQRLAHFDSRCPKCKSVERHRLAYLVMKDRIHSDMKALHFAPEPCIGPWLQKTLRSYTTADIDPAKADLQLDITNINIEDSSYDLVWCSHVLEHVEDDVTALSELYRIVAPGGTCVIQIPVWGDTTQEDLNITDPAIREKLYYQRDHVRLYGHDVINKMKDSGFNVEIVTDQSFEQDLVLYHSLSFSMTNEIFICTKPGK